MIKTIIMIKSRKQLNEQNHKLRVLVDLERWLLYVDDNDDDFDEDGDNVVDCPTQLICTWIFICVFQDKTKRTQQGNMLVASDLLVI